MATTPNNNLSVQDRERFPTQVVVTSNIAINQGDLVYWDPTNYTATPVTASSQVSGAFLGVAGGTSPFAVYSPDPYAPDGQGTETDPVPAGIPIDAHGCFFFNSTVGDTYLPFDAVTVGADSQTVTKVGQTSSNRVGFVIIEPPAVARPLQATPVPESIVGAVGTRIRVQLEPKHPVALTI